jgi:RNA polymerase I-specific transcription initiation factor RRN3
MLCTMMRLVPKARSELFPIIAARFPFWKAEKRILKWYCLQSFRILDYLPAIRKTLLELVIDKCLEIDVNIKIKNNGEVSIEEEQKDDNDGTDQQAQEEKEQPHADAVGENVDILSDTLDSLLALLLRMLSEGSEDGQGVRELYYEVLPVFESTIITTHKSKFVQYCVFFLCGLESERLGFSGKACDGSANPVNNSADDQVDSILHRDFASKLLELIMDPYRASLTRQSAACYLASFISRASYVESETVCESISALLRWAEAYMDSLNTNSIRAADSRSQSELHSLFYTVCQAAFYIMCFRGADAIEFYREAVTHYNLKESDGGTAENLLLPDPNDINLGPERWSKICNHELQPLRFCLESVRSEFLHVAHAYELVEEQILEKLVVDAKRMSTGRVNKKAASTIKTAATLEKQRRKGGVGGLGRGSNPLKSFFPFDPLLLRRSHGLVEPFYKHWQGPVEEEDVLVIDEAPDDEDNEQAFEMDDDDDQVEDESDDEDEAPVVVSDQDTKDEDSESDSDDDASSHDVMKKKQQQKEAWAQTLKRPRSQSMENGSW